MKTRGLVAATRSTTLLFTSKGDLGWTNTQSSVHVVLQECGHLSIHRTVFNLKVGLWTKSHRFKHSCRNHNCLKASSHEENCLAQEKLRPSCSFCRPKIKQLFFWFRESSYFPTESFSASQSELWLWPETWSESASHPKFTATLNGSKQKRSSLIGPCQRSNVIFPNSDSA